MYKLIRLIAESQTAHARLDAQNVVVDGEHALLVGQRAHLQSDSHLGVVDAREVAGAGWLVLLGLQSEGVGVDTRVRGAGVVVERLDLVEVLAWLGGEAVLAVQDQAESGQRTNLDTVIGTRTDDTILSPEGVGSVYSATGVQVRNTGDVRLDVVVCGLEQPQVRGDVHVGAVGGEVPGGVQGTGGTSARGDAREGRIGVAPDQLLDRVVVRQTNQLLGRGGAGRDGHWIGAGVLQLLDQVLVTLLGEAATLLGIQVHVVGPDLEARGGEEGGEVVGQVEVQTNLVVLQGNQRQVQTRVAVEEEQ